MDFEFYDTNIIIFLLDRYGADKEKANSFLSGRKILLTNYILAEIRNSLSRNAELMSLVEKHEFYFTNPDNLIFQEISNVKAGDISFWFKPQKLDGWRLNFLENELPSSFPTPGEVKSEMHRRYEEKLNSEIGTMHDERLLRASINVRISEYAEKSGETVLFQDLTYQKFPSIFVFQYLWWLRYSHQPMTSGVQPNDLYDLLNASIAPYTQVWAGERSIVGVLRQLKGRAIPSTRNALKYLLKNNKITQETFQMLEALGEEIRRKEILLPETEILNFSEFSQYYANWGK